ncbi:glycerol-3-phosphate dehydrogenase/oxidase [Marinovum sp. 2_MG-2023]|uniref:glycerol-3-phosphate dehydrogenase/oxidase n=1 Tax=unclassified Marinovum TaxID=2647166 RepID=UPI0026E1467F|nr:MULTISPECIES: glycerol-3-phosphate dehydrogenase/oxidase [unclassified Marinovum]MDO6730901.1 glycerol-3-phosphate dehydrogenase/oxidase [Marinovum sp. 2_MG-2023]MDO6780128.1 glycerol-3-phosphate dehydrogenase/oxidase [Marinovum sp. 1_MG-2023]
MSDTSEESFDVVIIGAGINGAGLFRDLCAQGLKCLIIDKGDFGSGTSAAPSRLIHGGLKYLETGELRLVAESTYERNLLLKNAAHLVRPLPTAIPILSWTKGVTAALRTLLGSTTAPRSRGALLVKAGLALYDFYGARARQMPKHRMVGRRRALAETPALTPRIKALGTYYDATVTAPERLVLELVQDGLALSPGAEALNWCAVTGLCDDGAITLCPAPNTTRKVRAKLVVNAAGPWIDRVNACLGLDTQLIGGTKGAHILLDHPELLHQLNGRMLYFEADDGRILLVVPFQGRALVGSTDIPDNNPDAAFCTEAETDYFLHSLRDLLPGLAFDRDQIVYAYAGIRPLPNSAGVAPGLISRDHSVPRAPATPDRPFPILSLVGGKWTTFRAFAAEVSDMVLAELGQTRHQLTDDMAIGGGRDMPRTGDGRANWAATTASATAATAPRVAILLDRYGTTARHIARHEGKSPTPLADAPDYTEAEIDWIVRHEHVQHLADILLRRTPLAISGQLTPDLCRRVAAIAAAALDWSAAREAAELEDLATLLARRHGVQLDLGPALQTGSATA